MTIYKISPYVGSKTKILDELYAFFPNNYNTYIEPFSALSPVYLNRKELDDMIIYGRSRKKYPVYLLNDLSYSVYSILKVLMLEPKEYYERLEILVSNETLFKDFKNSIHEKSDSLFNHAIKSLYVMKNSVGSMLTGNYSFMLNTPRSNKEFFPNYEYVKQISKRLNLANIFNREVFDFFDTIVAKIENGFMYLDPPYYKVGERLYEHDVDHDKLFKELDKMKPDRIKWMISYNDIEYIRELYKDYKIYEIECNYCHNKKRHVKLNELVIVNYEIPKEIKHYKMKSLFDHINGKKNINAKNISLKTKHL